MATFDPKPGLVKRGYSCNPLPVLAGGRNARQPETDAARVSWYLRALIEPAGAARIRPGVATEPFLPTGEYLVHPLRADPEPDRHRVSRTDHAVPVPEKRS